MTAVGGSIESVSLDGREFAVASDADATRKLGGFENEVQANGDGSARIIKTRVPWSIDGLAVEVDEVRGDQEYLQELADRKGFFPIAITFASGVVYQATGTITGEVSFGSQNATASIAVGGPGRMGKQ